MGINDSVTPGDPQKEARSCSPTNGPNYTTNDVTIAANLAVDTAVESSNNVTSNQNNIASDTEQYSDISESTLSITSTGLSEDWLPESGVESLREVDDFRKRKDAGAHRNFTICSVISNASDHGSIRSQRENVDRLLMSTVSATGSSPRGIDPEGVSDVRRPRSNSRGCMERNVSASFAFTYDQNYYKSADWLRFVPRRGSQADNVSSSSSDPPLGGVSHSTGFVGSGWASSGGPIHSPVTPDHYYRGFDNTRIRFSSGSQTKVATGSNSFQGSTSRRRTSSLVSESGEGELACFSSACLGVSEAIISPEISDSHGCVSYQCASNPTILPSLISVPIDEEDGTGGSNAIESRGRDETGKMNRKSLDHLISDKDLSIVTTDDQKAPSSPTNPSRPAPAPNTQFESSLRTGGFVRPPSPDPEIMNDDLSSPLPSHIQEQQMHMASWDSKYEAYACRVDQSQEDRSVEIPLFSMARPHMRAFHFAWLSFFSAFLAWFAITPLLSEVQQSLKLTKEQIWTSSICSVAGAVVFRCISGLSCDIYGARWVSAVVLFVCGLPTIFTGLVNTSAGLSALRLVVGIGGSAFVTCQYWTSTMFTREVAGTANALAAGWGNLGGGIAQVLVGSILFPFFKWIYKTAGTEKNPAELSWRTACILPGLVCTIFTFVIIRHADDSPKGNYRKRKRLGLMQNGSAMKYFNAAIADHNTWILLIQYGCCFGVELTTSNAAALYFKEEFELSTESAAAVASTFGWMNLFARGVGGFLSDVSNAYRGVRGRLGWQLLCFALEGIFVVVFSKAQTLAGAITALMTFSLFVQGAEGSTFGIVPYLNPSLTGTVAGIVGAGGNAGAVFFSVLFRQMEYREAFFYMGAITAGISLLSSFVWIRGYEGLFFSRRLRHTEEQKASRTTASETSPHTDTLPSQDYKAKSETVLP